MFIIIIAPGPAADNPLGSNKFFSPLNDFKQTHRRPNLTFGQNRSRSTQGHHLFTFGRACCSDVAFQVSRS